MLNQIIYTRCFPRRDLKNQGAVIRSDGFGVFSVSRELFADGTVKNYDFLQARLAAKNGSNEGSPVGLFHSYEYLLLEGGAAALSYEYSRPLNKGPRKNGQGHRPGNFVKQCLVGSPEGYPYEWFGSSVWNAHLTAENDYYMDDNPNGEPAFLSQVAEKQTAGPINEAAIRAFVNDGRADAVKAGIWFLVNEYAKPEPERKVLLIKDTPENVELWIAAITSAFSQRIARCVTFATNRSKLGMQTDIALFYYTDPAGRPLAGPAQTAEKVRHPYCMIVGYHPKDNFCSAVKASPAGNFQLIDGVNKTTSIQPDNTIQQPYYAAAVRGGEDFRDFCRVILASLPICEPVADLPKLYNATTFLVDGNSTPASWSYDAVLQHMSAITRYGISASESMNKYLLERCMEAYPGVLSQDQSGGFPLLKLMLNIARAVGRESDVIGTIADVLCSCMNDLGYRGKELMALWSALEKSGLKKNVHRVVCDIFSDGELSLIARNVAGARPDVVDVVLEMFFSVVSIGSVREVQGRYDLLCAAMTVLADNDRLLQKWLVTVKGCPGLLVPMALSVGKMMPSRMLAWWESVMNASGMDAAALCKELCRQDGVTIELVEQILANRVTKKRQCDKDTYVAFRDSMKALPTSENAGSVFFKAWLSMASLQDYTQIIRKMEECRLNRDVELELFRIVDQKLPMENNKSFDLTMASEVERWCKRLGTASRNATLAKFKREYEHTRKVEDAVVALERMILNRICIDKAFIDKDYYIDLATRSAEYFSPEVHLAFLCAFDAGDDAVQRRYVDSYVYYALSEAKGRHLVDAAITLCEAMLMDYKIKGRSTEYVDRVAELMEKSLTKHLETFYKSNLADQIAKDTQCSQDVKDKLIEILTAIAEKKGSKGNVFDGLGKMLGGLFGKK